MILAKKDFLIPPDIALAGYARAHEPKSLVFLEGGHLGKSEGDDFEIASAAARDWFIQWLKPAVPARLYSQAGRAIRPGVFGTELE
jgi:hypothetical protein